MACFTSFKEINNLKNLEIKINNSVFETDPFLVFISNSNELGYKFSLTPKASLQDGLLDVLIISKINKLKMIWLGLLVLVNKPFLLKEASYYKTEKLEIQNKKQNFFETQIDGEFSTIKTEKLIINVNQNALQVISPNVTNLF